VPLGFLTVEALQAIMPNLSLARCHAVIRPLKDAMAEWEINTRQRAAAFLAQIAHESAEMRQFRELASGAAYEGRSDLGNHNPGDGQKYKGRGPIQLTGRRNYRAAGAALGLDLEGYPEHVERLSVGCRVAGWFWGTHGCNGLADMGQFETITKRINGGLTHHAARVRFYRRAREHFGLLPPE